MPQLWISPKIGDGETPETAFRPEVTTGGSLACRDLGAFFLVAITEAARPGPSCQEITADNMPGIREALQLVPTVERRTDPARMAHSILQELSGDPDIQAVLLGVSITRAG